MKPPALNVKKQTDSQLLKLILKQYWKQKEKELIEARTWRKI